MARIAVAPGLLEAVDGPRDMSQDAIENVDNLPECARRIRDWRCRLGLTQEGLAEALDVTFSTVSRWENGHVKPSKLAWRALRDLAQARGCPLDEPGGREPSR
jgi:putative transcriptional regulator